MKQTIQTTQHFSFNVCNSIKYEKIEEKLQFLRTINPIRFLVYIFGALCQNMEFDRLNDSPDIKLFILVRLGRSFFVCCLAHRGLTVGFLLLQCSSGVVRHPRDLQVSVATRFCRVLIFASSQYLSVIYLFHVIIH